MSLANIFLWCKKYASLILLIITILISFFLFRKKEISFADESKKIREAHLEELRKIQVARDIEIKAHEEYVKQLQTTLNDIQLKYDAAKLQLDEKQKKEIAQIVKQYGNDPDALAQQLAKITGFQVIK